MRQLATLLITLLLAVSGEGAWAQNLSTEEKLAAIRKSLVETALEGPTKVTSTQWIDAQGVLRESSSFRSGVEVRGVRVVGYTTDSDGEASAKLQWQELYGKGSVIAMADAKKVEPACKPASAGGRLQHLLGLQWNVSGRFSAEEHNMLEELRGHWIGQLSSTGASAALWSITPKPRNEGRSGYEQALLGSGVDDLPWLVDLTVVGLPRSEESNSAWMNANERPPMLAEESARSLPRINWAFNMPAMVRVELQMRLYARNQTKPVLLLSTPMTLAAQDGNWGITQLSNNTRAQTLQLAENNALELYKTMVCQAVVGEVTQAAGKQFRINLGAASGVRVGDIWVLADAAKLPQRALEPGNTANTVMAKVQYVTAHYAQLTPTAGPAQNVQTRWAAWSAEDGR
jgi:hypothetical protein